MEVKVTREVLVKRVRVRRQLGDFVPEDSVHEVIKGSAGILVDSRDPKAAPGPGS